MDVNTSQFSIFVPLIIVVVNIIKKIVAVALPLLVIAIVTYGSLASSDKLPSGGFFSEIPHFDKAVHFIFYFAIVAALRFSFTVYGRSDLKTRLIIVISAVVYGGMIELLQGMYFNRSTDILDFTANSLGAVCAGFLLPQIIFNILIKKRK